jgi:hypothetical protein
MTEAGPAARFDCLRGEERIGAWLLAAPPQELVRATSWSGHSVVLVGEPFRGDEDEQEASAAVGQGLVIGVEAASQAMRALLEPDRA